MKLIALSVRNVLELLKLQFTNILINIFQIKLGDVKPWNATEPINCTVHFLLLCVPSPYINVSHAKFTLFAVMFT